MSGREQLYVQEAFDTNWIAPLGPNVNAFEKAFAEYVGVSHALALASGTAGLHLALILSDIQKGDEVLVSTLTFSASVNPIVYCGGIPVFIDSEPDSWNIDANLLADLLAKRAQQNKLPKALMVVHLYGQCANMEPIVALCQQYDITLIEDAAEALGATYNGKHAGTFGKAGISSFNGNKIITTSGGGMLFSNDKAFIDHARKLSTQARDPAPHYQHSEIGYNYRMSNILAGVGRAQLDVLPERIAKRRENFDFYKEMLGNLPGISFMPEPSWSNSNRWLTVLQIDETQFGVSRETIRLTLEEHNIESRPVWKPMHQQPIFSSYEYIGNGVADKLFAEGLCLPSGSSLSHEDRQRVVSIIQQLHQQNHALS